MLNLVLGQYASFSVHGGADSGGVAGSVDSLLKFIEDLLILSPGQIFAELLPGVAAMENLHPLFVHFPIALLSLFVVIDVAGSLLGRSAWRRVAGWLLYLGTLFAAMAVTAGLVAAGSVAHGGDVHEIMEHHEHLGITVLSLATALSAWRWVANDKLAGAVNGFYLALSVVLAVILMLTADLGGLMVYGHGVAVAPVAASNQAAAAAHHHADGGGDHHQPLPAPDTQEAVASPGDEAVSPDRPSAQAPKIHTHADGSKHEHQPSH